MAAERQSPARSSPWPRRLATAAAIVAAALLGFLIGEREFAGRNPALPVIGRTPAYTLVNQLGERISSRSFRGKVEIVTFLFPYCTTLCPLIAAHLANFENLEARPAGIAKKVAIVSFNLDPAATGPPQMRAFLKQYGWDPEDLAWQYLTGSPAAIRRVVRDGFGVAYQKVPLSSESGAGARRVVQPEVVNPLAQQAHVRYDIVHDDVIEVVDQKGRIRTIYQNANTVGPGRLLRVVQALLGEGS
jgi:protein SCO1